MPRCSTSHMEVPVIAPTCSDHFQPGSYRARPIVIPPISTTSNDPLSNARVSSGASNRLISNSIQAPLVGASVAAASGVGERRVEPPSGLDALPSAPLGGRRDLDHPDAASGLRVADGADEIRHPFHARVPHAARGAEPRDVYTLLG